MRWQEEQVQSFGNHQFPTLVPASLIQNQQQVFAGSNSLLSCKRSKSQGKGSGIDLGHEKPTGLSAAWFHKAIEIHPLIPRANYSPHSASLAGPDAAQDGFG